jgi:hypothetical protein
MIAISGRFSGVLNLVLCVCSVVVALGPHAIPGYVPALWASDFVQTAAYAAALISGVNAYLHFAPTPAAPAIVQGPQASPPAAMTVKTPALALLVAGGLLAALLGSPGAKAQGLTSLARWTHDDLTAAIALANKANPADTAAAECFGLIRDNLDAIGPGLPITLKLATDAERLWLFHQTVAAVKASVACQAVCSRMAQIAPLVSRVLVSPCDVSNLLR